jgi:hypothetical protein
MLTLLYNFESRNIMKILLAIDGSPCSDEAVNEVVHRPWPAGSEIKILNVVHVPIPDWPDPLLVLYAARGDMVETEQKHARVFVDHALRCLQEIKNISRIHVTGVILEYMLPV